MISVDQRPLANVRLLACLGVSAAALLGGAARAQQVTAPAASPTASGPTALPPSAPLPSVKPNDLSSPTTFSPAANRSTKAAATASSNTTAEVVVTGQRAALQSAIATKKNADIILDSISADDAGKLPDNSVTEVLQRIVGVNITRIQTGAVGAENFLAEGTGIQIRGLDSVVSLLNGRDSFSSVNGRTLAFEDIPPELMQGVDVYKTLEGNLPEGGLGGTINLRTRQPFDYKGFTVAGDVEGNYADFAGATRPDGNILVSDRWHTNIGEFGLLVDLAYSDLVTRADGVQVQPYLAQVYNPTISLAALQSGNADGQRLPNLSDPGSQQVFVPFGVDFSEREDERKRTGIYAAGQWKPNDKLIMGLTVFNSEYRLDSFQHYLMVDDSSNTVVPVGATASFNSGGLLTSTSALSGYSYAQTGSATTATGGGSGGLWGYTNNPYDFQSVLSKSFNYTTDISLTGDYQPNSAFDVKFAYQHVDSGATSDDHYAYDYAFLPQVGVNLSSYGSSALPKLTIPSTIDLSNASNYGYLATMDHLLNNRGEENAAYADATYKVSDTGLLRALDFGFRLISRSEDDQQTPYNYQALSPYYGSGPYNYLAGSPASTPAYNQLVNTGGWFGGGLGLPAQAYFPSQTELSTDFATLHKQLGTGVNSTQGDIAFVPGDTSKIVENQYAAYVMALFRNDTFVWPFRGNIGVRVVDDTAGAQGNIVYPQSVGNYFTPVTYPAPLYGPSSINFSNAQTAYHMRGGHSEVDALPSANIQFLPTPQLHLRFAASEGLDRPSFAQISPQGTLGSTYVGTYNQNFITSIVGQPDLKPETALQLDSSLEYYFRDGGLIHAAVFYKKLYNYIGTRSVPTNFTLPTVVDNQGALPSASTVYGVTGSALTPCPAGATVGTACPQTVGATMQEYFNESVAASLEGIEFGIQKYATFLPRPFNGFGVDFNYTFINSSQPGAQSYDTLGRPITGLPVTGLSRNTINAQLLFDNGPISARLAYNWRDDFLVTTSAYQTSNSYTNYSNVPDTTNAASVNQFAQAVYYALPVWSYPVGTLDGSFTYRLNTHLTWVLEASNLTNTQNRLYMGSGDQKANRSWYTADRRYRIALRFNY